MKLGLPLEYKKLPQYFDAWNINDDTERKNEVIERLLKQHNVHTILDLTCGTGSQVLFLTKHGYKVIGVDLSPALLEIARTKALKEKLEIKFIEGDMRTLKVGTYDAVITIFNAIGHLTKAGFIKAIRNINKNLKKGGIYIFDILNLEAMTDDVVKDLACYIHKKVQDIQIFSTQCSELDRTNGILTSYNSYMLQKNVDKPQIFTHKFSLQIYTAKELNKMLTENGFEVIRQYGSNGSSFIKEKTKNVLTIAKKI